MSIKMWLSSLNKRNAQKKLSLLGHLRPQKKTKRARQHTSINAGNRLAAAHVVAQRPVGWKSESPDHAHRRLVANGHRAIAHGDMTAEELEVVGRYV